MRPKPFKPVPYAPDARFVADATTGLIWHFCALRTLYADTDRAGVVYHANYLRYFEVGRAALMRDVAYSYKEIEDGGTSYPIVKIGIDYFRPLYYDDIMHIHTRLAEMERVRLTFDYTITHEPTGEIVCKGFTCHCAINGNGVPVAIDEKTAYLWDNFPR